TYQHDAHPMMVSQNKWRAARFGNAARLVDQDTFESHSLPEVVDRLAERLHSVADDLGCLPYLERCRELATQPTSADRQLALRQQLNDDRELVRQLAARARISPPGGDAAQPPK
ncbi:MAG TPA: hypothetical protein PKC18_04650, partial [Lacipirellulaceae bacterium]|nr:hypothetical protein [Lacipirellulaceae bacterium]